MDNDINYIQGPQGQTVVIVAIKQNVNLDDENDDAYAKCCRSAACTMFMLVVVSGLMGLVCFVIVGFEFDSFGPVILIGYIMTAIAVLSMALVVLMLVKAKKSTEALFQRHMYIEDAE